MGGMSERLFRRKKSREEEKERKRRGIPNPDSEPKQTQGLMRLPWYSHIPPSVFLWLYFSVASWIVIEAVTWTVRRFLIHNS